jgi:hypothetical protein
MRLCGAGDAYLGKAKDGIIKNLDNKDKTNH